MQEAKVKWWSSKSLSGLKGTLTRALNLSRNGSTVTLEVGTVHSILQIIEQAKHIEKEHEGPAYRYGKRIDL